MRIGTMPRIGIALSTAVLGIVAPCLAAAPTPSTQAAKAKAEAAAKQKAAQLNAAQTQALAAKNRRTRTLMARLASTGNPTAAKRVPLAPNTLMLAKAYRPGSGNPATLRSLTPNPVTVGGEVTLSGSQLGEGQPSVDILFERAMVSVECSVRRWSPTSVVATVPSGIAPLVGDRGEDVLFRVEPAGRDDGPTLAARVVVSSVPAITGTSEAGIEPGQLLIVQGTALGTTAGQARLRLASLGVTRDMLVDSWADTAVVVHLAEGTTGLPREAPCTLELTNSAGRAASRDLTCRATLVYEVLTETITHYTERRDGWQYWTDSPFFRETLRNGWQVFSVGIELVTDTSYTSCEILSRPTPGSDSPATSVRTGASGGEHYTTGVTCNASVTVNGPRGSDYHGASVVPPTP